MDQFEIEFTQFTRQLPDANTQGFEEQLEDYVLNQKALHFKDWLHRIVKGSEDRKLAYIAFLSLVLLYRENEEVARLNLLFEEHGEEFREKSAYAYFEGLMYKSNGAYLNSIASFEKSQRTMAVCENPNEMFHYAESIVTVLESGSNLENEETLIDKGQKALAEAIELRPNFALYFATKARFLIYEERFKEAGVAVNEAIKLEERGHDYQLRVAKYHQLASIIQVKEEINLYRMQQIQFNEKLNDRLVTANSELADNVNTYKHDYEEQMKGTQQMLEDMKQQNLQMLGFFTAIISFTVGSIQIIKEQSFAGAALLLLVLAGVLLIAYAGFGFLMFSINKRSGYMKQLIVFVLAILMICAALFVHKIGWLG